jgi:hypothetical protein
MVAVITVVMAYCPGMIIESIAGCFAAVAPGLSIIADKTDNNRSGLG